MERLITMVKYQPKFKHMLEKVLEEQAEENICENARKGKVAGMKAQRRLIEARQR